MIDSEDREFVLTWTVRVVAAVLAIFGSAFTLGLAWRLFELVRG